MDGTIWKSTSASMQGCTMRRISSRVADGMAITTRSIPRSRMSCGISAVVPITGTPCRRMRIFPGSSSTRPTG